MSFRIDYAGDLKEVMGWKPDGKWRLAGFDTFAGEWYPIWNTDYTSLAVFETEGEARKAAQEQLDELEKTQPSGSSGGQGGIQDRVYIIHPNGVMERIFPEPPAH